MSPRFLLYLPLMGLAGCATSPDTSVATVPTTSVANLPRHKHLAEVRAAASAELLRPAPAISELTQTGSANFGAPRPGSAPATYLASLADPRPKRGLIICEPISTKAASFGAGCARWIEAMGAGSTAFEVVPTWGMAAGVLHSKSWENMALERGRAVQLARAMDASHVAVGSFDGQKLQYQLLDVREVPSKIVGSFAVQGSPARIVAGLPQLARQLVNATGAGGAQIPAQVGLGANDLAFLGSLPRDPAQLQQLKPAQLSRIAHLATNPLGAVFVGRTQIDSQPVRVQAARTLLAVAPTNAFLAGEVARCFMSVEKEHRTQVLQTLDHKFPRNEAIALGNASLRGEDEDYFAQVQYSERAVRLAPHSPVAWYLLAGALYSQADEKRQGVYWTQMNVSQKTFVMKIYPQAQAAAWKAVDLDPTDSDFWLSLSKTATMNSNPVWACDALAESLKRDPHNEEALGWGIEIFQPKWYGNAASFATMARIAVSNGGRGQLDIYELFDGLKATNQESLKRPLLQKLVVSEPNNVPALREYSYLTRMELSDPKAALPYARRAVSLAPNDTEALTELADIEQHDFGQYEASIKLFRRAIKLEPKNPLHWVNMALSYAKWGKKAEARTYAIKGRDLGYRGPHPVWNLVGLGPGGSELTPTQPSSPPLVAH